MKRHHLLALTLVCAGGWAQSDEPISPQKRATRLVDQLHQGDFVKASSGFDVTMSNALPPNKLEQVWKQVQRSAGPMEKRLATRLEAVGRFTVCFVTCKFQKTTLDAKVVIDAEGSVAGLFFLPSQPAAHYQDPAYGDTTKFDEIELTVGSAPWELPATLSLPKDPGPFPAVVLVHGSGPSDRDETVGAAKPFKDIAWGLATQGIATLRYEKRTKTYQSQLAGGGQQLTVEEETVADALAATDSLRQQRAIDPDRIFVVGHSLGGYLIPRIAAQDSDSLVAGYVSLAGNTRSLQELILVQTKYLLSLDGEMSESDARQYKALESQVLQTQSDELASIDPPPIILGAPASYWLDLRAYEPTKMAQQVQRPMLFVQGERDYQVTMEDFHQWQSTLKSREDVQFKSYPSLNHLLISGQGKSTPQEYERAGNVAVDLINDIASWIKSH